MKTRQATAEKEDVKLKLQELYPKLNNKQIMQLAVKEDIDPVTVRRYLKGNVIILALGKSILANGLDILNKKQSLQKSNAA